MDYVTIGLLGVLIGATGFAACLILYAWNWVLSKRDDQDWDDPTT
jgi:hypothetical protein